MAKDKETKATAQAEVKNVKDVKDVYLPMRSLLFNPVDGHAYTVKAFFKDDPEGKRDPETDEIIQVEIPQDEREPGPRLDPYTFTLNGKTYEAGFIPEQNPSPYEHIESFPTEETTAAILSIVQRTFPGVNFAAEVEEKTGRTYMTVVNPVIQHNSAKFQPGALAIDIMLNGEKVALEKLAASLRTENVLR